MDHAIPIPAATLVLLREDPGGGPPALLMIERAAAMAFAGGAMVFPGGRVDPGDALVAADPALADDGGCTDREDAIARVAAIRETIEEVGIAVGFPADAGRLGALRGALAAGADFGASLRHHGVRLDLAALVPFSRWLPIFEKVVRRFDTRFYAAVAPRDAAAIADGGESVRAIWATARAMLDQADAGRVAIIFPTRRNLEWLVTHASFDALRRAVAGVAIETISPWIERRDGADWLCIPDGLGYPIIAEPIDEARRG